MKKVAILRDTNFLQLPDDRKLCYAEYGDPEGLPIFVFHGNPNSRLLWGVIPEHQHPNDCMEVLTSILNGSFMHRLCPK